LYNTEQLDLSPITTTIIQAQWHQYYTHYIGLHLKQEEQWTDCVPQNYLQPSCHWNTSTLSS